MRAGWNVQRGVDQMIRAAVARVERGQWNRRGINLVGLNERARQLVPVQAMGTGQIDVQKQDGHERKGNRDTGENDGRNGRLCAEIPE